MFFSRARATASSIDRSTRAPVVTKGAVRCDAGTVCGGAGGVWVCARALAPDIAIISTAAAVTTTFFFTKSSTTGNDEKNWLR
jgi:hypothetical protein